MATRVLVQRHRRLPQLQVVAWGLFILFLFLIAFAYADTGQIEILGNKYALSIPRINKALSFSVAILGLQVVVGYTGQLALGQSFFFGTGAYSRGVAGRRPRLVVAVDADRHHPGVLRARLSARHPGAADQGVVSRLGHARPRGRVPVDRAARQLEQYTAGAAGKTTDSDLVAPSWLPLDGIANLLQGIPLVGDYFGDGDLSSKEADRIWVYTLFVLMIAVLVWLISNLIRSRPGRAIRAIRDNETSAAVSGVHLSLYKTIAFGISTAIGGIGGMMYVAELGIASPGDFTQLLAILFIVGLVTGGVGTNSGAVLGGLVIAFVPEWSSSTEELPIVPERWLQGPTGTLFMGVLLIVLMFFLPGGIVAGVRRIKARYVVLVAGAAGGLRAAGAAGPADHDHRPLVGYGRCRRRGRHGLAVRFPGVTDARALS